MTAITHLGDGGVFWIIMTLLMLCFRKTRRAGAACAVSMVIGLVLTNLILKNWVARVRPYEVIDGLTILIKTPHDWSFPSGHTIACFEGAIVLMLHDKRLGIPALVIAILVAFSRLYLYVHYPTDVLTSVVLGSCFAILAALLVKKGFKAWENRKKAA
jgi:undecaprenyl-diphosphatase